MTSPLGMRTRLTYEDYLLFPDDGKRHEIISGEHFMTPSPSTRHQRICFNIARQIDAHARQNGLGTMLISPMDVVLSDEDIVQPDLLFVSAARAAIITEKNVAGAPDLVVEVLSEATRKADLTVKYKLYAARGVQEYWVVDPEIETVAVYRAGKDGFTRAAELSREAGHLIAPMKPGTAGLPPRQATDSLATPFLPGLALALAEVFS